MKIGVTKGAVDSVAVGYVRVVLTDKPKGTKRFVERGGIETLEIGIGENKPTQRQFIILCRSIIQAAKANKCKKIALELPDFSPALAQLAGENFEMANYEFTRFKTKPKEGWSDVEEVLVCNVLDKQVATALTRGQEVGRGVNACRELANTPGGDVTPTTLAKSAKDAVKGLPVKVTTIGEKEMQKLGMGAILGVAKGSTEKPTFTIMEYKGSPPAGGGAPIVLCGKGVTFDSGGLNLKSSNGIYEMHMDMSGAAAVIHTVALAARLKLKKHVIGLIPAVENMPGNQAYRPGDVLKSMSGKTIEVLNTDAEGRLILADALTYAKRYKPAAVLDVATLTGASLAALGLHASAVMSRDDALSEALLSAAEESGDYAWRLPLWEEYEESMKSAFADIANVSASAVSARYGGAIEGGIFLHAFASEIGAPWAHIDMAPRMTSAPGDELAKGAAGAPVRLLLRFVEKF